MKFDELVSRYATPDVLKHLRSQQFQVSLDILGIRITQGLTKQQAAFKTNLSIKSYESFENGSRKATLNEYQRILSKIKVKTMKTYIYFKSGNVYQIDLQSVRDRYGLIDLIDYFWNGKTDVLQATYLAGDGSTGQILFRLSDVEDIEQTR